MFPELCPVCHYMSYKEESGEYYSDGMQISPDEGYCSHCDFRYSQHVKHPMEEQVKKHIEWLKKMSDIYKQAKSLTHRDVKRRGSIFKIANLEDFSRKTQGFTKKERANLVIKNLLRKLKDYNYEAGIKDKIKPKLYKIQIEVTFVEYMI